MLHITGEVTKINVVNQDEIDTEKKEEKEETTK